MNETDNYWLDIGLLGISETWWANNDKLYLAEGKKFMIYSGRIDDKHSEGVALLMTKKADKSLSSW